MSCSTTTSTTVKNIGGATTEAAATHRTSSRSRIGSRINIIVLLSLSAARCSSGLIVTPSSRPPSFHRFLVRHNHNRKQFHRLAQQSADVDGQDHHHHPYCFEHSPRHRHRHRQHCSTRRRFGTGLYSLQSQFLDDSSSSSAPPGTEQNNNRDDDDQTAKWERMYQEGETAKQETMAELLRSSNNAAATTNTASYASAGAATATEFSNLSSPSPSPSPPVKVVTFDLDNTLWKTGPSISAANDALNNFLESHPRQIRIEARVEVYMKQLFESDPTKYAPVTTSSSSSLSSSSSTTSDNKIEASSSPSPSTTTSPPSPPSPVLLTQLRTDAIAYLLQNDNSFSSTDATELANEAFEVWTNARHDACLDHMAPGVVETLEQIRNMNNKIPAATTTTPTTPISDYTAAQSRRKVIIGAITDGNSDPRRIEILEKYFDFVINAESVGTSKPNKRVYIEAGRTVLTNFQRMQQESDDDDDVETTPTPFSTLSELGVVAGTNMNNIENGNDDDDVDDDSALVEGLLGPYWCHIGDDFLKDIVAAKNLGMRTIWSIGLVKEKLMKKGSESKSAASSQGTGTIDTTGTKSGTEMDVMEFMNKVSSQSVVTMGIGADDYLASSLTGEFVDAVADDFEDIGRILSDWNSASKATALKTSEDEKLVSALSKDDLPVATVVNGKKAMSEGTEQNTGGDNPSSLEFIIPRAFRILRDDCGMNVPAPLRERDVRTMQDVLRMAQVDKSSGVFAFDPQDVAAMKDGTKVLMIRIGDTGLEFSREIFTSMTVDEVLSISPENPLTLTMYMKDAVNADSFDLF